VQDIEISKTIYNFSNLHNLKVIEYIESTKEEIIFIGECDLQLKNKTETKKIAIKQVQNSVSSKNLKFQNEYLVLSQLIPNNNIIQIFTYFDDTPTEEMVKLLPQESVELLTEVTGEKKNYIFNVRYY